MSRTTAPLVKELLMFNYDHKRSPALGPYIASANAIVTRVVTCASAKGKALSTDELELVERWLSAYMYCHMDPLRQSSSTQGASGANVSSQSLDGEQERYKRGAIELDYSGCLNAILNRKSASAVLLRIDDPYSQE